MLTNTQLEFIEIFKNIAKMGWVPSNNKGKGSIGLTFEELLGKPVENFEIPDFKDIEIKTHATFLENKISLFHAAPDGKYLFETKRLVDKYGHNDKILRDKKILFAIVNTKEKFWMKPGYIFNLKINKEDNRVYLQVLDCQLQLVEAETFWSFDLLREKLMRKFKYLAFIEADRKMMHGQIYFKYRHLTLYKLKGFDQFLNLLEQGLISITFKVGVVRSGTKIGNMYDHGTSFSVDSKNFEMLFTKEFESIL